MGSLKTVCLRVDGAVRRLCRWEYWPTLPIYGPILPVLLWKTWKARSIGVITATNPGMESGGFVGDSKSSILNGLVSSGRVAPFRLLEVGSGKGELQVALADLDTTYPVVLKPDSGERGAGVSIVRSETQALDYLREATHPTIVQVYIPGVEYGVFYERHPNSKIGRVTGMTHKSNTIVVGDGELTLEELILKDRRARCQASIFFDLHADRLTHVVPQGETVSLNLIGTHSRGSLFLDACDEVTPELEKAIDEVSQSFAGFYFGRYDIRCDSLEALKAGRDFWVVELNGVTSEPTHMYDPKHSVFYAWRCLAKQWGRAIDIAVANRESGASCFTFGELRDRVREARKS